MATIGQPSVGESFKGLPVSLDELETAFYTLAPLFDNIDYDKLGLMIARAKSNLTEGRRTAPEHMAAMASRSKGGSSHDGGTLVYSFEHLPQEKMFHGLRIDVRPIGPGLYVMCITDERGHNRNKAWIEQMLAEALGVECILDEAVVHFPLETINGTCFRFDFQPFVDGLGLLGLVPVQQTGKGTAAQAVARYYQRWLEGPNDRWPALEFHAPALAGIAVSMFPQGCQLIDDYNRDARHAHCAVEGTVVTGPLRVQDGKRLEPVMRITITRPKLDDTASAWPLWATPDLKATVRALLAGIVASVER